MKAHLLAYCFNEEDPRFLKLIASHKKARLERIEWIVEQLTSQGLDLDTNEVRAEAGGGNLGRPHVAAVLVNKGYVSSHKEAFIRYLGNHASGTHRRRIFYTSHTEVIDIVRNAGGATVLAHPNMLYSSDEIEKWISDGLDGLEVITRVMITSSRRNTRK
ncbi:MAG: hypothetical protein U5K69_02400 [Balneolaceae bacterium]|nr:hypothetical protein [Balneolaceae bacterium]